MQRYVFTLFAAASLAAGSAVAQSFPAKAIHIITAEPGSGNDLLSRLIGQYSSGNLGQQVVVENRGVLSIDAVQKAAPDGYTLLLYGSPIWLAPYLRSHVSYDPVRDFAPITLTTMSPTVVVVHPSVQAQTVKDLIALAKAKPGALNYGTTGTGTPNHLAAELFRAMAAIEMVRINYKSTSAALGDLMGGQLHLSFHTIGSAVTHVKSGRLRALGVTGAQRSAALPELPTVAATGLPGYEAIATQAMFAPAKTPPAAIATLNREIVRVLHHPDTRARALGFGVEVVGSTPAELDAAMKAEMAKMGKVIRDAGIRDE